MTIKKFDLAEKFENSQEAQEMFQKYIDDTYKYVKKYKDDFPEGLNGSWNNSVDAFRHAYMQAHSRYFYGILKSKGGAWLHEIYGNVHNKQSKEEEFMDKWNNNQGQEIALEVKSEMKNMNKNLSKEDIEDYIAYKVIQRMRRGKIIRNINESINIMNKKQKPTGQAVPVSNTPKSDSAVHSNTQNFSDMIKQSYKSLQSDNNKKLNRIFKSKSSYTGDGHWVTMNGAHIFIED